MIDALAIGLYVIGVLSSGRVIKHINARFAQERDEATLELYNYEKKNIEERTDLNNLTIKSLQSRIYQARVFMITTTFLFFITIYLLIYKAIFVTAEFRLIYLVVLLLAYIIIYKLLK